MITACYVAHNEAAGLARSMLSVKAYVDRFVIVDVAFASNGGGLLQSGDGQRRVAERAASGLPLCYIEPGERLEEHEARQRYIEAVPLGEWLLVIDGDEVLVGEHSGLVELVAGLPLLGPDALQLRVFTTAVLAPRLAPDIDADLYAVAPRIATSGFMPRLVRRTPELRHGKMEMAPGQWSYGGLINEAGVLGSDVPHCEAAIIINDHAGQSHAAYQHDYRWETAQGGIT